ncbi:hypothetical protein L1887_50332 [Cichorium endivia]|nr:hypothetical protein L1887_50332 [Cichorium endivia]
MPTELQEDDDLAAKKARRLDAPTYGASSSRSAFANVDAHDRGSTRAPKMVSLNSLQLAPVSNTQRAPADVRQIPQATEDSELIFPESPRLVPGFETPPPPPSNAFRRPHALSMHQPAIWDAQPAGQPSRFEHRPSQTVPPPQQQPRYFHYRPEEADPYELPRDNPIDALISYTPLAAMRLQSDLLNPVRVRLVGYQSLIDVETKTYNTGDVRCWEKAQTAVARKSISFNAKRKGRASIRPVKIETTSTDEAMIKDEGGARQAGRKSRKPRWERRNCQSGRSRELAERSLHLD